MLVAALVSLLAAGVVVAAAGASTDASRPAGSPDLAAMSLAVHDLPAGTKVESQGYVRDPDFVASYQREFDLRGMRLGRSRLLLIFEGLDVEPTPAEARSTFGALARFLSGRRGAEFLRSSLVEDGLDRKGIVVGRVRRPSIGHGALVIPVRIRERGIVFETAFVFVRFDRVLGSIFALGRKVYRADTDRLTRIAVARVKAGLVPVSTLAPAVSGVLHPGQLLTAGKGTWTGDQLTFTYQWERCDAAGAECVAIAGATGPTYTVETGDLASTVRLTVTGRNRLGSAAASSPSTAVVAGRLGSPTGTVPPAVSGTPQVGETLSVGDGTWTGDPTAFAYQWRRCNASGGACVDIAGATATTYVVTAADSRSTLRVLVVATNAAGPGGAISAPTAAVP
jgi:hypothetical protein